MDSPCGRSSRFFSNFFLIKNVSYDFICFYFLRSSSFLLLQANVLYTSSFSSVIFDVWISIRTFSLFVLLLEKQYISSSSYSLWGHIFVLFIYFYFVDICDIMQVTVADTIHIHFYCIFSFVCLDTKSNSCKDIIKIFLTWVVLLNIWKFITISNQNGRDYGWNLFNDVLNWFYFVIGLLMEHSTSFFQIASYFLKLLYFLHVIVHILFLLGKK